jgi:hypothetical protein
MKIKDTAMQDMTYDKFRELILLGRRAIELRLMGILIRPRAPTAADKAELKEIHALLARYNALMDEKYWYRPPPAANDGDGAKK